MIALYDTFNDRIISKHRKIARAVRACLEINRMMTSGAYLPLTIKKIDSHGDLVNVDDDTLDEFHQLRHEFQNSPLSKIQ
jgi:hypothetical protein